jgi:hypothetical protein
MNNYTTSRRDFMRQSATLLGGTLVAPSMWVEMKRAKHISLQLYSVRDEMKKDPLGTLKLLSAMGYREAEPAAYTGRFTQNSTTIIRIECNKRIVVGKCNKTNIVAGNRDSISIMTSIHQKKA